MSRLPLTLALLGFSCGSSNLVPCAPSPAHLAAASQGNEREPDDEGNDGTSSPSLDASAALLSVDAPGQLSHTDRHDDAPADTPGSGTPSPSPSPPGAPIPVGTYWVRRPSNGPRIVSVGVRHTERNEDVEDLAEVARPIRTERGSTYCVPMIVAPGERHTQVTFREARRREASFTYRSIERREQSTSAARSDREGDGESEGETPATMWALQSPRLRSTTAELQQTCATELHLTSAQSVEPSSADEPSIHWTNVGPLFADEESCNDVPHRYVQQCHNAECTYDDARAAPFSFGDCEEALTTMDVRLRRLREASHEQRLRTLDRFRQLVRRRGNVYEYIAEAGCTAISVRQVDASTIQTQWRYRTTDRTRVRGESTWYLEPLDHVAVRTALSEERHFASGASGAAGSFVYRTGLYLGHGFLYFGEQTFYLSRHLCESMNP